MTSLDGLRAGPAGEEGTLAEKRGRMGLRPGQLDPQTSEIGHRMRELAGRKAYLRNFWYAAGGCSSPSLPQGCPELPVSAHCKVTASQCLQPGICWCAYCQRRGSCCSTRGGSRGFYAAWGPCL